MKTNDRFKICFTTRVEFKDMHGTVLKAYDVGDVVAASATVGNGAHGSYFITAMGGIYFDEAVKVEETTD